MKSPHTMSPEKYDFAAEPPVLPDADGRYPIPVPGQDRSDGGVSRHRFILVLRVGYSERDGNAQVLAVVGFALRQSRRRCAIRAAQSTTSTAPTAADAPLALPDPLVAQDGTPIATPDDWIDPPQARAASPL